MTEVRFYHLQRSAPEQALPQILSKAIASGRRVVVRVRDEAEAETLNDFLWTAIPDSFLPHGTKKDGNAERQPVWITPGADNPNGAEILVLTGGQDHPDLAAFTLCCDMLDGRSEESVKAARQRWKIYKDAGFDVTYWQQTEQGGWEKKA